MSVTVNLLKKLNKNPKKSIQKIKFIKEGGKMKNKLLSSLIVGAMTFALGAVIAVPAFAQEEAVPAQNDGAPKCEKPAPFEFQRPMTPEERAKFREEKKAEFEARLKLSAEQKAQIEKIKKEEKAKLAPYQEKIKKEKAKLDELFEQQRAIRMDSMKKFEATLTEEQKAELEKMKEEMKENRKNFAPPMGPDGRPLPPRHHHKMCPPNCDCGCNGQHADAAAHKDCNCQCHEEK